MKQFQRARSVVSTEVDGEAVLLDPASGEYYALNHAGCLVWSCLSEPICEGEIAARLQADFAIDPAVAKHDVHEFLSELVERGLVAPC